MSPPKYMVVTPMVSYIHYIAKSIGSPASNERFDYFSHFHDIWVHMGTVMSYSSQLLQQRWKYNFEVLELCFHLCCCSLEVYEMTEPKCTHTSLVFGDEFLSQGLYLKSHRGVQLGLDQSSSSTLTESSFLFDSCLIHRDTVMLE